MTEHRSILLELTLVDKEIKRSLSSYLSNLRIRMNLKDNKTIQEKSRTLFLNDRFTLLIVQNQCFDFYFKIYSNA